MQTLHNCLPLKYYHYFNKAIFFCQYLLQKNLVFLRNFKVGIEGETIEEDGLRQAHFHLLIIMKCSRRYPQIVQAQDLSGGSLVGE